MTEPVPDEEEIAGEIEECLDEIDEFIGTLQRFSDPVIAESLRVHLASLLRSMLDDDQCSASDVREFVASLERDALGIDEDAGTNGGSA
jgi:hypothetical protein